MRGDGAGRDDARALAGGIAAALVRHRCDEAAAAAAIVDGRRHAPLQTKKKNWSRDVDEQLRKNKMLT